MEIILLQDVEKVGFKDEIVVVKNGFGRNFLIPNGKAILATESAKKVLSENLRQRQKKDAKIISEINKKADKLNGLVVKIKAKTIEEGKQLFGSITASHLADELEKMGHEVDRKFIKLSSIKVVGTYDAEIRLHKDIKVSVVVEVVAA
tara:strand:- start:7190 stop:7633 length:444 start_codon:yes stop_codon:yes gene_type:complete